MTTTQELNKTLIEVHGNWLTSAYGVYIIEITYNKKDKYYYVGQTGDAKAISARSPFYRIAAHLGYSKNTQNQVYEGLKEKLDIKSRKEMEDWLANVNLKIHFFKTDDYQFCDEREGSEAFKKFKQDKHLPLRRKTLALETALLQTIQDKKYKILNKSFTTYRKYKDAVDQAKQIWTKIGI